MAKRQNSNEKPKLKRKQYEKEMRRLQAELCHLQEWVKAEGRRIMLVFEGRDGAGKGGTIKAITERVSPRVFRVVALPAPTDREKSQMYVQRYLPHLPAAGEVVIFDRSWYNRAGVERVMGFCTEEEATRFLQLAPLVEKAFVDSGNKRRARLNALTHILSKIPYEELPRAKIKLPKRQDRDDYKDSDYPF